MEGYGLQDAPSRQKHATSWWQSKGWQSDSRDSAVMGCDLLGWGCLGELWGLQDLGHPSLLHICMLFQTG